MDKIELNNQYRERVKENQHHYKNKYFSDCCGISIQTFNNWLSDKERCLSKLSLQGLEKALSMIDRSAFIYEIYEEDGGCYKYEK